MLPPPMLAHDEAVCNAWLRCCLSFPPHEQQRFPPLRVPLGAGRSGDHRIEPPTDVPGLPCGYTGLPTKTLHQSPEKRAAAAPGAENGSSSWRGPPRCCPLWRRAASSALLELFAGEAAAALDLARKPWTSRAQRRSPLAQCQGGKAGSRATDLGSLGRAPALGPPRCHRAWKLHRATLAFGRPSALWTRIGRDRP